MEAKGLNPQANDNLLAVTGSILEYLLSEGKAAIGVPICKDVALGGWWISFQ